MDNFENEESMEEIIDLSSLRYHKDESKNEKKHDKKKESEINETLMKEITKSSKKETKKDIVNTKDEAKKKRTLIYLIQVYLNEFEKLKQFKKTKLNKMSYDELIEFKRELEDTVGTRSTLKASTNMVITGIQTLETVLVEYSPFRVQGLSNICKDEEFVEDIKLIILQNMPIVSTEPRQRVVFKLISTAMQLHTLNSYNEQLKDINKNNRENIEKINQEYADI